MITEDYVSFETAKLLKENGFDEPCSVWYSERTSQFGGEKYTSIEFDNHNRFEESYKFTCSAPTLQMAMKWLREVHNIHVVPKFDFYAGDYTGRVYDGRREGTMEKDDYMAITGNKTYEEAAEAAIKYCLENLI